MVPSAEQLVQRFVARPQRLDGAGVEAVEKALFALLDAQANAGMTLTESFAMTPAAAVSGFYFAHPQAQYFAVSKIGRDQLEDWAQRTGMSIAEAERWLAPIL